MGQASSCVSVPPPAQVDDQIGGNVIEQNLEGIAVENGSVELFFDAARSYNITSLSSKRAQSQNLLYRGALFDRYVGVEIQDRVWSHERPNSPVLRILASGAAVYQIQVEWSASANTVGLSGKSIYTVYPDGRIHRSEEIDAGLTEGIDVISSYVALRREDFTGWRDHIESELSVGLIADALPNELNVLRQEDPGTRQGYACTFGFGTLVGQAWNVPADSDTGASRLQQQRGANQEQVDEYFGLFYDWDWRTGDTALFASDFLLFAGQEADPADPCDTFERYVGAFLTPPEIVPSAGFEGSVLAEEAGDSDQDGYNEAGGHYALSAAGRRELSFSLEGEARPPSSTFKIHDVPNSKTPEILLGVVELVHGTDFLYQVEGESQAEDGWIFLDREFTTGSVMQIRFP